LSDFEARTRQFVLAMVAACQGDSQLRYQVASLVGQMALDEATRPLANSLSRIIAGERGLDNLTSGLEGEPAVLVEAILRELLHLEV
jgi:hypothetical protein